MTEETTSGPWHYAPALLGPLVLCNCTNGEHTAMNHPDPDYLNAQARALRVLGDMVFTQTAGGRVKHRLTDDPPSHAVGDNCPVCEALRHIDGAQS
jgi:hypothetical protein